MGMLISRHKDRHSKPFTGPVDKPVVVEEIEPVNEQADSLDKKKKTKKTE